MNAQKIALIVLVVAAVCFGVYQSRRASRLNREVQSLQQLQRETQQQNEAAAAGAAAKNSTAPAGAVESSPAPEAAAQPAKGSNEVLRLRGEVGRLRRENASIASTNAISKVTANPEARTLLRSQQKMGMGFLYKGFATRANLSSDQGEKLNETLADYVMDNVDAVTTALRDKPDAAELARIFDDQTAAMEEKVKALLGDEGFAQFKDYNAGLLSTLTGEQFKGQLSGTDDEKQAKAKQLSALVEEEKKTALAAAGLPEDYQAIPMLNFRNIASETEGDKSVKLLDDIYQRVGERAKDFLSPEEVKKFEDFRALGVNNNRGALLLNRTMMAPIGP